MFSILIRFLPISMLTIIGDNEGKEKDIVAGSPSTTDLKRAEFLINEAIDEDELGHEMDAIELYLEAVEVCLKAKTTTSDDQIKSRLSKLADQALTRAEELKENQDKAKQDQLSKDLSKLTFDHSSMTSMSPVASSSKQQSQQLKTKKGLIVLGSSSYSKEELAVLKVTSVINNREYVPFLSVDLTERFAYPIPFTDKHGYLALSTKVRILNSIVNCCNCCFFCSKRRASKDGPDLTSFIQIQRFLDRKLIVFPSNKRWFLIVHSFHHFLSLLYTRKSSKRRSFQTLFTHKIETVIQFTILVAST